VKVAKRSAFTLLEVLSVTAIIATLAAITMPVYHRSVLSAKTQVSVNRLRQFGVAISLYQSQWDFRGYDSLAALALPPASWSYGGMGGAFRHPDDYRSPCGYDPSFDREVSTGGLGYYITVPHEGAMYLFRSYRQNSLLFYDFQCNPKGTGVADILQRKRSLGLLMSGQVVNAYKTGDVHSWKFYTNPPD